MPMEINEDNIHSQHSGYTRKRCIRCGKEFLVAKASESLFDTCGDEKNCRPGREKMTTA